MPAAKRKALAPALSKPVRAATLTLAVLLSALTLGGIPQASAQNVVLGTPNGGYFSFSLAAGASTAPVTLPVNIPWHVTGAVTSTNNEGIGEVEMLSSVSGTIPLLEWVGLNSANTGTVTFGDSAYGANPVVQIDFSGAVTLVASSSTNSFVVTNSSSSTQTGYVSWIGFGTSILEPTNTALGTSALNDEVGSTSATGNENTAIGFDALYSDTSGSYNTATGVAALESNQTGSANTALGYAALSVNTGSYNTASGYGALYLNNAATFNTGVGYDALYTNRGGGENTAFGAGALFATTVTSNTAVGFESLYKNSTGKLNVALGWEAGYAVTTGSNNIDIGSPGAAADSGVIRIGTISGTTSTQIATYIDGIYNVTTMTSGLPVLIDSKGQLGTVSSSERFKTAIEPMGSNTEKLLELRPVTFHYKAEVEGTLRYGLIAEEVAKVYPELVVRDESGRIDGVRYDELAPMLLNELQQQHTQMTRKFDAQAAEIQALKQQQRVSQQQLAELKSLNHATQVALRKLEGRGEVVAQR